MTSEKLEELKENNPWKDITVDTLWSDNAKYVTSDDKEVVVKYNKDNKGKATRFRLEIPPEPWQGNPLEAKVIILTLNPGYVDNANRLIAKLLEKSIDVKALCKFKNEVLHLNAKSMMPPKATNSNDVISTWEAFNMLGDWYWVRMLRELREAYVGNDPQKEDVFYQKFSIVEYCPYSSEKFCDVPKLKSMKFTKLLINGIKNDPDKLFIIMRGEKFWKTLLGKDVITNNHRCQYLSKNNLKKNFADICSHLGINDE